MHSFKMWYDHYNMRMQEQVVSHDITIDDENRIKISVKVFLSAHVTNPLVQQRLYTHHVHHDYITTLQRSASILSK